MNASYYLKSIFPTDDDAALLVKAATAPASLGNTIQPMRMYTRKMAFEQPGEGSPNERTPAKT